MNVVYEPGFSPEMLSRIERTMPAVKHVLGRAIDRVTVEWMATMTPAGPGAILRLSDDGVAKEVVLSAVDLDREFHIRGRLYGVWDDVLAERSRQLGERIRASLAAEGV